MNIKQIKYDSDFGYKYQEFDDVGNISRIESGSNGYNDTIENSYDSSNRLIKSKIYKGTPYGLIDTIQEETYIYSHNSFIMNAMQSKIIHDTATNPLPGGLVSSEELNQKFEEDKLIPLSSTHAILENEKLIFKKVNDFQNNETLEFEFRYKNENLISKEVYIVEYGERKIIERYVNIYNNENYLLESIESDFMDDEERILELTKYEYKDNYTLKYITGLHHMGQEFIHKIDNQQKLIEKSGPNNYRVIYIHDFDYDRNVLNSVIEVSIKERNFQILSTKRYEYYDS